MVPVTMATGDEAGDPLLGSPSSEAAGALLGLGSAIAVAPVLGYRTVVRRPASRCQTVAVMLFPSAAALPETTTCMP